MEENEKITPANIRELINAISDPILKSHLFRVRVTRVINYIAVTSVIAWGVVLVFVYY